MNARDPVPRRWRNAGLPGAPATEVELELGRLISQVSRPRLDAPGLERVARRLKTERPRREARLGQRAFKWALVGACALSLAGWVARDRWSFRGRGGAPALHTASG